MASVRIPVGMSDVVILFGPQRARERAVRAIARDTTPVPRTGPAPEPRIIPRQLARGARRETDEGRTDTTH